MESRWMRFVGLFLLCLLVITSSKAAKAESPSIRIGLVIGQEQVRVMAPDGFFAVNLATGAPVGESNGPETWTISGHSAGIRVDQFGVFSGPIRLQPQGNGSMRVNGNPYQGEIEILQTQGLLTVVNELPVEEYLYGVVPREMPADFPMEALKAQAVAARTYTYANWDKHSGEGFNLCATIHCQVYGGAGAEHPNTTQAVDSTRDEVLRYRGNLINAYYHASSGGHTEDSENVWSHSLPYLRGVPDYDYDSPYSSWSVSYEPEELTDILHRGGVNVGNLESIEPLSRGVSGRVNEVRVSGSRGSQVLTGEQLRSMIGYSELRSTMFDVEFQRGGESFAFRTFRSGQKVSLVGADGKRVGVEVDSARIMGDDHSRSGDLTVLGWGNFEQDWVVFQGSGWGHGIGMSQWGAKAMAEMAPVGNQQYYQTILKHYYQGAVVEPY